MYAVPSSHNEKETHRMNSHISTVQNRRSGKQFPTPRLCAKFMEGYAFKGPLNLLNYDVRLPEFGARCPLRRMPVIAPVAILNTNSLLGP
jgi:hypothetical protein